MATNWKEGLSFLDSPESVMHKVGGQELEFLPVSAITLLKLRGLIEPLSECLSVLFDDRKGDAGSTQRQFTDKEESGNEFIMEAVPESTLKLRMAKREAAVSKLVQALTDDKNMYALGQVILDSLRKQMPKATAPPAAEFMGEIPFPQVVEMLMGVAKANKGVFGPLGNRMGSLSQRISEMLESKLAEAGEDPLNSENASPTAKPFDPTKPTMAGTA